MVIFQVPSPFLHLLELHCEEGSAPSHLFIYYIIYSSMDSWVFILFDGI